MPADLKDARTVAALSLAMFPIWAVHDLEEARQAPAESRRLLGHLPATLPIPATVREHGVSRLHTSTAIGVMAGIVGSAAVEGARTGGRSPFFRVALEALGWHAVFHVATAAVARRRTFGAATSAAVVIPYWLLARRHLTNQGIPPNVSPATLAALPPILWAAHGFAACLNRLSKPSG